MERLMRPPLDRWVLLSLVALSLVGNLIRWPTDGVVAYLLNVVIGVAAGFALYGLVLLIVVTSNRAWARLRPHA